MKSIGCLLDEFEGRKVKGDEFNFRIRNEGFDWDYCLLCSLFVRGPEVYFAGLCFEALSVPRQLLPTERKQNNDPFYNG